MRQLVVLVALSILAAPVAAQTAGFLDSPFSDMTDFRDEPDSGAGDDANGIAAARAGTLSLIVNSKWISNPAGTNTLGQTTVDAQVLFTALGMGRTIVPLTTGEFHAWYGEWADYDGDGYLPSRSTQYFGQALGGRDCADAVGLPSALVADCQARYGAEFSSDATGTLVSYVSPGRPIHTLGIDRSLNEDPSERDPTFGYVYSAAPLEHYYAPGTADDFFFVDNSMLQQTRVETLANPTVSAGGDRSRVRAVGEPVDIDIYVAIDPSAEAVYADLVTSTVEALGCEVERPWEPLEPATGVQSDCAGGTPDLPSTAAAVGPVSARVLPPAANEVSGHDYAASPHTYFDVRLIQSLFLPPIIDATPGGAAQVSMAADGTASAPLYAGVNGRLGAWHDLDGDGWVGSPTADAGCTDPYDCGMTTDPNEYEDDEEWTGLCRDNPGRPYGEIMASFTSSTGAWGSGVYVMTDRSMIVFHELGIPFDWYETPESGAIAILPYDDIVTDVEDGRVDALYLEGVIRFHVNCDDSTSPGVYRSYEHFLFLDGGNRGYGITLATDPFEAAFEIAGIATEETVADTDFIPIL